MVTAELLNRLGNGFWSCVDALVEADTDCNQTTLGSILASIEQYDQGGSLELNIRLGTSSIWRSSNLGQWLTARLLEHLGRYDDALVSWNAIIASCIGNISEARLSRARAYQALGPFSGGVL